MFEFDSKQKELKFEFEIRLSKTEAIADIPKILQIVIILLSNAFKYTTHGIVSIVCRDEEYGLSIIVADSGIGIRSEELPFIFVEFGNPSKANKERKTSSGF